MTTIVSPHLQFCDSGAVKGREDRFCTVDVWVAPILASWSQSLFAHDWLKPDGTIKTPAQMSDIMQRKRAVAEAELEGEKPIKRPVLGIGILDNIEMGSGRDIFLALAARGAQSIPVHIPHSNKSEFKLFIRAELSQG